MLLVGASNLIDIIDIPTFYELNLAKAGGA